MTFLYYLRYQRLRKQVQFSAGFYIDKLLNPMQFLKASHWFSQENNITSKAI
jgi:hypothetical protein